MPTKNIFQGNKNHPYHFSVGAVLVNDKGEVLAHHFRAEKLKGYWTNEGLDDFYLLMRETLEPGEDVLSAVGRGLQEEFGATGEVADYLGSIQSHFMHEGVMVEKTTIYFLVKFIKQDLNLRSGDIESQTDLEWHKPEFLIPKMKSQAERYGRTDVDESTILERVRGVNLWIR